MAKAGRPISANRIRKAESQASDVWAERARSLIKSAMEGRVWGYQELSEALAGKYEVEISAAVLNRRINRGGFSAAFMLMCLDALDARTQKGQASALEQVIGGWGGWK